MAPRAQQWLLYGSILNDVGCRFAGAPSATFAELRPISANSPPTASFAACSGRHEPNRFPYTPGRYKVRHDMDSRHSSSSAKGHTRKQPGPAQKSPIALMRPIETAEPIRGDWPNYGKLGADIHHCHLKKGSPTYVAVWEIRNREINLVEITYAGTHEKAPY